MTLRLKIFILTGVIGLCLLISSLVVLALFNGIIDKKIKEEIKIKNGGSTYDNWVKSDIPYQLKFYVFHVKNADEVVKNSSVKPQLEERGPYVFDQWIEKVNISFEDDDNVVTYDNKKTYIFNANASNKFSLSDSVTLINLPFLTILSKFEYFSSTLNNITKNLTLTPEDTKKDLTLFMNITVGQLLFEGKKIKFLKSLRGYFGNEVIDKFSKGIKDDTFGLFYKKNGTIETGDQWTIYTGKNDMNKYAKMLKYNNQSRYTWWEGKNSSCNTIDGTDGLQFGPPIYKDYKLDVYVHELCRKLKLVYLEDFEVEGISAYRFTPANDTFTNPYGPDGQHNLCYCTKGDQSCNVTGLLDISTCSDVSLGAPMVMSSPHFYGASDSVKSKFDGLNKINKDNENNFRTLVDIEPYTGITIQGSRKIQLNVAVKPYQVQVDLNDFRNISSYYFPLLWLEQQKTISKAKVKEINEKALDKVDQGKTLIIIGIVVGSLVTLLGVVMSVFSYKRRF